MFDWITQSFSINSFKRVGFAAIKRRNCVWSLEEESCFPSFVIFQVSLHSSRIFQKTLEQNFTGHWLIAPKGPAVFSPWGFKLKLIIYLHFRNMWATKNGNILLYDCAFSLARSSKKSTCKAIFAIWKLLERTEGMNYLQRDAHDIWKSKMAHVAQHISSPPLPLNKCFLNKEFVFIIPFTKRVTL